MLSKTIKEYFDRCVRSEYLGSSKEHPIIILNAIKNIIGDNRKEYSKKLSPNDTQRIIRALEVNLSTKTTLSEWHIMEKNQIFKKIIYVQF